MDGARGRALVAGWFSFDEVIATVGDVLDGEVTAGWLQDAGWTCDLAVAPYMGRGVDWRAVDPSAYDLLVFTTGPLIDVPVLCELLDRFAAVVRWALNVSLVDEALGGRFDRIWERDSSHRVRPDLAFAADVASASAMPRVDVAVAYAPPQPEYRSGRHREVAGTLRFWLNGTGLAADEIDVDMFDPEGGARDAHRVVDRLARAKVVVSMRLHGAVLALRAGRPVVAVDPVAGGDGKVSRQLRALDWPCVVLPADCTPARLDRALQWCSSPEAAARVRRSGEIAARGLADLRRELGRATV